MAHLSAKQLRQNFTTFHQFPSPIDYAFTHCPDSPLVLNTSQIPLLTIITATTIGQALLTSFLDNYNGFQRDSLFLGHPFPTVKASSQNNCCDANTLWSCYLSISVSFPLTLTESPKLQPFFKPLSTLLTRVPALSTSLEYIKVSFSFFRAFPQAVCSVCYVPSTISPSSH